MRPHTEDQDADNRPHIPESNDADLFSLLGTVGDWGENNRQDVIKAQILLGNAGYYDLVDLGGPTGWAGGELKRSLRRYQKDRGLSVDGIMLPDGETMRSLNDDLGGRLAGYVAPSPQDADDHHDGRALEKSGNGPSARSNIAMPDADGRSEHPTGVRIPEPGQIYSDAPPADASLTPGAQYAQVAVPVQPLPPAIDGRSPVQPGGPLPQDRPDVKAAAQELERRFGYAKENAARWAGQAKDAASQLPNLLRDIVPDAIRFAPIGESEKAQTQTPPLMPSAPPEEPPSGRPPEDAKTEAEQFIPPQLEEWVEAFPQFDQELLRQLLNVANSNGDEHTQLGNRIFIQEYLDELKKKYPEAAKAIQHVAGGHRDGNIERKKIPEEHLPNAATKGQIGSTRTDITFGLKEEIIEAMLGPKASERHRINSQTMTKSGDRPIKKERVSEANLRINAKGQQVDTVPKLRPDSNGMVSEEKLAAYRALMRERAAEMIPRWIADLKSKGLL